jgi:hypothetical protein
MAEMQVVARRTLASFPINEMKKSESLTVIALFQPRTLKVWTWILS